MITSLSIRNIILIDKLDVKFSTGLTVLTGETGAGKSIILDAVSLALGARAQSGLVRSGETQGSVTLAWEGTLPDILRTTLTDAAIDADDQLIFKRTITSDGKSKAFINDQPVTLALLKKIGDACVELQGQFEQHGLLDESTHLHLLDTFSQHTPLQQKTASAFHAWHTARTACEAFLTAQATAQKNFDFLTHAVDELSRLKPQAQEEDTLLQQRHYFQNFGRIAESLNQAHDHLLNDNGVEARLHQTLRSLERIKDKADTADMTKLIQVLDQSLTHAQEASALIEQMLAHSPADETTLEAVDERLFQLRNCARKHNVTLNDLPALLESLSTQLSSIQQGDDQLKKLQATELKTRNEFVLISKQLSASRETNARHLEKAVLAELAPLKLDKARFVVERSDLAPEQASASGMDRVSFQLSTNPGSPLQALSKVASGGELSRFLLAMKVILAKDTTISLIFDEIDSGVGGAVSAAVGERLKRLSQNNQVFVITHSPQVAAAANQHYNIQKTANTSSTKTQLTELDTAGRELEIARMLSSADITPEARAQAKRLMHG